MKVLLDTHLVLWYLTANPKLPNSTKSIIDDLENVCYVSVVSLWEIAIKHSLGKLDLMTSLEIFLDIIKDAGIETLPINESHILKSASLEFHHQDPFDRMIIAQALVEDYTIITKDQYFKEYSPKLIWD